MVHPLAEPELSGDVRPRYVRARRGPTAALVCATSIERNAAVEICDQTPDTIVESARAAVEDAVSQLQGPAEAALVFDCAARSAWFGGALAARELEALVAAFGDPAPCLAGVYTRGEIGRTARGERRSKPQCRRRCVQSARTDGRDELLRRFVEAARRAQIVTIVNRARTEAELGGLVDGRALRGVRGGGRLRARLLGRRPPGVVGSYGLRLGRGGAPPRRRVCSTSPAGAAARHEGPDLLTVGRAALVLAPFGRRALRGVVGVARLYEQGFDEAEAALLEAVAASIGHALERLRLAEERDRLYREAHERGQAARVIGSIADGVAARRRCRDRPALESRRGGNHRAGGDGVLGRPLARGDPGWSAVADSLVVAERPASVERSGDDRAHRRGRTRGLALDQGRRLRRGNRLRLPRPDRGRTGSSS